MSVKVSVKLKYAVLIKYIYVIFNLYCKKRLQFQGQGKKRLGQECVELYLHSQYCA